MKVTIEFDAVNDADLLAHILQFKVSAPVEVKREDVDNFNKDETIDSIVDVLPATDTNDNYSNAAVAFGADIQTGEVPPPPADIVELDANGYPWDERIHASSKKKIADGTWRQKRNVNEALVEAVQTELSMSVQFDTPPEPPADDKPLAPPPPPPPPPADDDSKATFGDLMLFVSKLKAENKLTDDQFRSLYEPHDLASFAALSARPDLVPVVMKEARSYDS